MQELCAKFVNYRLCNITTSAGYMTLAVANALSCRKGYRRYFMDFLATRTDTKCVSVNRVSDSSLTEGLPGVSVNWEATCVAEIGS